MGFDLDAYLERIEWRGELRPDRATLGGLLAAHMAHIPFENLDVLLGRGVQLDIEPLQRKLVGDRRGGYCFEHCTLFAAALEAIGFEPSRHTARVVVVAPRNASPRTHMFLTVPLPGGSFVVDPGFGALAPRVPVPLLEGARASAGEETHWMAREGELWVLRAQTPEKAVDCWVSAVEDDNLIDFEVGNHFTATHPSSSFVNRIMLRALTDDGRVSVMNRDVTLRRGARTQTLQLPDRAALRALLAEHFGFDLPEVESIRVPTIDDWR